MPVDRHNPKLTRKASDFATLADVTQIVDAAFKQYRARPWYKKLWRKVRGVEDPKQVPGLKF